jgi:N-acetylglutamate synthase-like GNAT family acetyltransferase
MDYQINDHILLRFAEEKDASIILEFIRGLAEYEHLLDANVNKLSLSVKASQQLDLWL